MAPIKPNLPLARPIVATASPAAPTAAKPAPSTAPTAAVGWGQKPSDAQVLNQAAEQLGKRLSPKMFKSLGVVEHQGRPTLNFAFTPPGGTETLYRAEVGWNGKLSVSRPSTNGQMVSGVSGYVADVINGKDPYDR